MAMGIGQRALTAARRNVNGIRNPFSYPPWNAARTFPAMFDTLGADVVVMQELKIQRKDLRDDMVLLDGWDCYFSLPRHKKGYSGVAVYTRNAACAPVRAEEGLLGVLPSSPSGVPYRDMPDGGSIGGYPSPQEVAELCGGGGIDPTALDAEGRCVVLEFPAFVLLGVYSPANSNGLRDDFRLAFLAALDRRVRNLVRDGKRVVLVGDLNVSRDERDSASAADDRRKAGVSHEEYISTPNRRIFNQLLVGGEVVGARDDGRPHGVLCDTTRAFHPRREGMYTHWDQKINARPGNYGARIDFVLVSDDMRPWVARADIQEGLLGSDHCPVYVDFHDRVPVGSRDVALLDLMNPPGTFEDGKRRREWRVQDVPPSSAKRMPEFDKRRSIKSMFAAPGGGGVKKARSAVVNAEGGREEAGPPEHASHAECLTASSASQRTNSPHDTAFIKTPPTTTTSTTTSPIKRAAPQAAKERPRQRQKTDATPAGGKGGQQSLKGFFSIKNAPPPSPSDATSPTATSPPDRNRRKKEQGLIRGQERDGTTRATATVRRTTSLGEKDLASAAVGASGTHNLDDSADGGGESSSGGGQHPTTTTTTTTTTSRSPSPPISPSQITAQVAAHERSQRSWGALFAPPVAPLCDSHHEPCKTMQTRKKGSNQGRGFWMCARPLGPSGAQERGTQWRCPTFIWCSDWGGKREGVGGEASAAGGMDGDKDDHDKKDDYDDGHLP